jgi:hypothetical protein
VTDSRQKPAPKRPRGRPRSPNALFMQVPIRMAAPRAPMVAFGLPAGVRCSVGAVEFDDLPETLVGPEHGRGLLAIAGLPDWHSRRIFKTCGVPFGVRSVRKLASAGIPDLRNECVRRNYSDYCVFSRLSGMAILRKLLKKWSGRRGSNPRPPT